MTRSTRSRNLDLLRWYHYGNENLSSKISRVVTNRTYVSKMCTDDMPIGDITARAIESVLGLPNGWLDRNTVVMVEMNELDWELHTKTSSLSDTAKRNLLDFISGARSQNTSSRIS